MSPILFPLLVLVAGCNCAPDSWIDIGGTVGYESTFNGTIGGNLKADRDGLSVNGTGGGFFGESWAPTLVAIGHAKVGNKVIAGDASLKTVIDNSWSPSAQAAIGRNSNGTWLLGFTPNSVLKNKFMLTPNVRVKTGDDARKLAGLPLAPVSEDQNVLQQVQVAGAPGSYAYGSYGYIPNPQWQVAQPQYGQPQYEQPQYGQPQYSAPQYGQPQYVQPQYGQPQYGQPQYSAPQYGQPQHVQPQYGQPQYGLPQYVQPQYQNGAHQYLQPQYGQPQYGQPQYAQPQYYVQQQYGQAPAMDQSQIPVTQTEQQVQQQTQQTQQEPVKA